ncbi:TPM domain-containing protein [Enterococcus faecalis]
MRKWWLFLGSLFLIFGGSFQTADAAMTSVDDGANLLTTEQIAQLNQRMKPLAAKSKASIFIVTTTYNDQDSPQEFADRYILKQVGKNQNAILFLIDMDNRQTYLSTSGNMIDYMDDQRIDDTLTAITTEMSNGNYYGAAQQFLAKTNTYFEKGVPGGHYRIDEATGKIIRYKVITPLEMAIAVIGALVAGLAFFFVTISRYQLKSGTYRYPFREKASLDLTQHTDQLTNSFITTRRIPRNNNSGGGSGGGSTTHSTGGGSFGGGGRSF